MKHSNSQLGVLTNTSYSFTGAGPNWLTSTINSGKTCLYNYNYDGQMTYRKTKTQHSVPYSTNPIYRVQEENFEYDIRGLLTNYYTKEATSHGYCLESAQGAFTQWQYKYNPFGEREQKRLYSSSAGDANGGVHPWVYYLLGGKNEQYAVYNGCQLSDPTYTNTNGVNCSNPNPNNSTVFMYPVEYNSYSGSGTVNLSYQPNESGTGFEKYYKINDHLGSVRAIMRQDGFISCTTDYKPFGEKLSADGNDRLSFINKEKDAESSLGDFGVRKYDEEIGRFTSIDPLWENDFSLTPYHYCYNNPVNSKDVDGKQPEALAGAGAPAAAFGSAGVRLGIIYIGGSVAVGVAGWAYAEYKNPGTTKGLADAVSTSFNEAINNIGSMWNSLTGESNTKQSAEKSGEPAPPPQQDNNDDNNKTKGLEKILKEHIKKLEDYTKNPLKHDNEGSLAKAIKDGNFKRAKDIYNGRIRSLERQIRNFERQIKSKSNE